MIVGKVKNSVWGAQIDESLIGLKLLEVQPYCYSEVKVNSMTKTNNSIIAVDRLGAGVGDTVVVATGTRVRNLLIGSDVAVKSVIVGIVDDYNLEN